MISKRGTIKVEIFICHKWLLRNMFFVLFTPDMVYMLCCVRAATKCGFGLVNQKTVEDAANLKENAVLYVSK